MYNYDTNNETRMVFLHRTSLHIYVPADQSVVNYFSPVHKVTFSLWGETFILGFLPALLDSSGIFHNFDKILRKKCTMT